MTFRIRRAASVIGARAFRTGRAVLITSLGACLALLAGCSSGGRPAHAQVSIRVTEDGFVPNLATVPRGVPLTLIVTRTSDQNCADAIVFAPNDDSHDLPMHQHMRIEFPNGVADTLRYGCPMGMYHGMVVPK